MGNDPSQELAFIVTFLAALAALLWLLTYLELRLDRRRGADARQPRRQ